MIGIYGGTFDPVHYGHLRTALEVNEIFALHELRLLPCAQPAHRTKPEVSTTNRLQMLQLAIQDYPQFSCDVRELKRSCTSYMVDTLATIRAEIATTSLVLFIGMDVFNNLTTWHRWQALFGYAHIVVMIRPGYKPDKLIDFYTDRQVDNKGSLKSCSSGKFYFQQVTQLAISASLIRKNFAQQKNNSFLLPEAVIKYIQAKQLYKARIPLKQGK